MESKVIKIDGKKYLYEITYGQPGFMIQIIDRLAIQKSVFQTVEVFETVGYGKLMMIDGCTMVSTFENYFYHEMISHPALFIHPNPKKVWIIGGGDCGTLREVLKHKCIDEVVQIEIDKVVTDMAQEYFPELCESNNDPRAKLLFIDGIKFVNEAPDDSVDIIIIDSTDPMGPAEGLFNADFYEQCYRCLTDEGILVQQSESPLLHKDLINKIRRAFSYVGFQSVATFTFPQSIYPSGWWSVTMAAKYSGYGFDELAFINNNFDTKYYNVDIHHAALTLPEELSKSLV